MKVVVAPAWVGDMVMADSLLQLLVHTNGPPRSTCWRRRPRRPWRRGCQGSPRCTGWTGHGELGLGRRRRGGHRRCAGWASTRPSCCPTPGSRRWCPGWRGFPGAPAGSARRATGCSTIPRLDPDRYPLMIERFMALALPGARAARAPIRSRADRGYRATPRVAGGARICRRRPGAGAVPGRRVRRGQALAGRPLRGGRPAGPGSGPEVSGCSARRRKPRPLRGSPRWRRAPSTWPAAPGCRCGGPAVGRRSRVVCNDSGLMHVAAPSACRWWPVRLHVAGVHAAAGQRRSGPQVCRWACLQPLLPARLSPRATCAVCAISRPIGCSRR
jgi:hypothetical protein